MKQGRLLSINNPLIILAIIIGIVPFLPRLAAAQISCPYATIRLDTTMTVDANPICQAAQPLAEDGARVFVYLTDFRPGDEAAWFNHLDQIEAEAGLRDLSQADSFAKDGLAFEFSTATQLAWGQTVTFGERFDGTNLDTDPTLIPSIKNDIRLAIAAGNVGDGFAQGLEAAYVAVNPPPSAWGWVVWGVVGAGGVGVAGYVVWRLARPIVARRKAEAAQQAHLEALRSRTNNLLSAADRLLDGSTPNETILYQLFSAYGGETDSALQTDILEWLRRSQEALRDAFDLRQKLDDPANQSRPLSEQVQAWETLYLTLAGSSERILTLTDEELRTLLDPMLTLEREETGDVQLTSQLDQIRRELAGMPLKIDLQMVDPASTDAEGILGYLDRVQGQIAYLRQVNQDAPKVVAEANRQRHGLARQRPADFFLSEAQLFAGIDSQIDEAEQHLIQDKAVVAWELGQSALADLDVVSRLLDTMAGYQTAWATIESIISAGFKPPALAETSQEIEADLDAIKANIDAGNYQAAMPIVEELKLDYERALNLTESWQALAEQNNADLDALKQKRAELGRSNHEIIEATWRQLQTYAEPNWADLSPLLTEAQDTLATIEPKLAQIEQANSLEAQQFDRAELALDQAQAALGQIEQTFDEVVNRLAEVQAAAQHWASTLAAGQADIERAEAFRDQEDRKISPSVDEQLDQARTQLAEGEAQAKAQNYRAAIHNLSEARSVITAAYAAASEQVAQLNQAQADLKAVATDTLQQADQLQTEASQLSAASRTAQTMTLMQQALNELSAAKQAQTISADLEDAAWLAALQQAIDLFRQAGNQVKDALASVQADVVQIQQLRAEAQKAIEQATATIQRAETVVNRRDAGNVGLKTLQQARKLLPEPPTAEMPPKTLQRVLDDARESTQYAIQAEELAQKQLAFIQDRQRQRDLATWTSTVSRGGWGQSHGSSLPQMPPISIPTWGRSGPSSGHARPSSRPPSPRSSSMGGSRRR